MIRRLLFSCLVAGILGTGSAWAHHTQAGRRHPVATTVRITQPVLAGGQPLAPGTYELVVTDEHPSTPAGMPSEAQQSVEFVRDGMVVARETAEVFPRAEQPVGTSSASGSARAVVEKLKADNFLRIAVNGATARYLVYLPISQP